MDPAVIAALITTPTAIIAATAAYAAGRAQARGSHRGPIDAVRRQHERDAYAAFVMASRAFAAATTPRAEVVVQSAGEDAWAMTRDRLEERAEELRRRADTIQVKNTNIVVELEGPEHVSDLAGQVAMCADDVCRAVRLRRRSDPAHYRSTTIAAHSAFSDALIAFMRAARDHLNGRSR
ncbi:hypothetical protein [Streptomyces phaeochromogenes]|uniref:hypothetical protein n=1 Tax=Streptomyces phaeochromogenes TaxID=1923 RepID=UPI0036C1357E